MPANAFRVEIPGQPPSWNHMYTIGRVRSIVKVASAEGYQTGVAYLTKLARPPGWDPKGMIRVCYWFDVHRDIDCDNMMKAINDAVAKALGVDDKRFLPCVLWKRTGVPTADAKVILTIYEEEGPMPLPSWVLVEPQPRKRSAHF